MKLNESLSNGPAVLCFWNDSFLTIFLSLPLHLFAASISPSLTLDGPPACS